MNTADQLDTTTELALGDILDAKDLSDTYELHDWGAMVDDQYTYAMIDPNSNTEYLVVVDSYRVVEKRSVKD